MDSNTVPQKEQKQRIAAVDPANTAAVDHADIANAVAATPAVDDATRISNNDGTTPTITLILSGRSVGRQHRRGGRRALVGGSQQGSLELDAAEIQALTRSFGKRVKLTRSLGKVNLFSEDG